MKYSLAFQNRLGKLLLTLALVVFAYGAPTAQAFDLGGLSSTLGDIGGAVQSIGNAVSIGTGIVSDLFGIFNGGGGSGGGGAAVSGGVPNVPNGAILPGPGNSALGLSYVRDVFLPNLTNWVVSLVLAGSVVVVVAAGIMFTIANGNQEMTDKARETVIWGVIGMVITVLAYAIVRIVITINYLG